MDLDLGDPRNDFYVPGFDLDAYRSEFGPFDAVHFNGGFEGRLSRQAYEAMVDELDQKYYFGRSMFDNPRINDRANEVRAAFARTVHAPASSIALSSSTTLALSTLLLSCVGPGDIIVSTDREHDALEAPLQRQLKLGREVHFHDIRTLSTKVNELVEREKATGLPRKVVIVASAVEWNSGRLLDPKVKNLGLLAIIDGAQALPGLGFDARQWGPATAFAVASQKNPNGTTGNATVYIGHEIAANYETALPNEWSEEGRRRFDAAVTDPGAHPFDSDFRSPLDVTGTLAAYKMIEKYGANALSRHAVHQAKRLAKMLRSYGLDVVDRDDSALVAWRDNQARTTATTLSNDYGILVRPIDHTSEAPLVRATTAPWTTDYDIERLVASLVQINEQRRQQR